MLRDILNRAIEYAEEPIPDRKFITHYNDAVHDLAMLYDTAKRSERQTIACEDPAAAYPLIDGCLKIERVLTSGGNYFSFFNVEGNKKIKFAIKGTYFIHELLDQYPVTSIDDIPTINSAYFKAIAEYVASKAIRKTNSERSNELLANSAADADIANKNIRRANNPNRRVYAPRFR